MSLEKAKKHLEALGLDGRILTFDTSSATVELAAEAVGCEPCRIAKTLSFDAGGETLLIVAAGDARIDNAKFKALFHTKAKMLPEVEVESRTGHAVGGVCPFGINGGVRVVLDESLRRFDTVYPAAGNAASAVRLTPDELARVFGGEWADVCKY